MHCEKHSAKTMQINVQKNLQNKILRHTHKPTPFPFKVYWCNSESMHTSHNSILHTILLYVFMPCLLPNIFFVKTNGYHSM